jgi:hypothetical protein
MRKIIIILLCCFVITGSAGVQAESDQNGSGARDKKEEAVRLRLFQLNHILNYLQFQMPSPLYLRGLWLDVKDLPKLFPTPKLKLRKHKNVRFSRALWMGLAHFVYATSSYWIRQDVMKEDWEYQFTWEDQKKRFLFIDGMRFDSNTFQFNWTHAGAGAMYYNYGRASNMSPGWSFVYSFVASYFWEFVIEFKEVVSINDMIATPIGGVSIGESMFQLGRFFRSRRGTVLNKIGRFLSNPVLSLFDWLDRKQPRNRYAFDEDVWNDCRISMGPRVDRMISGHANTFLDVDLETQLVLLPEYGTVDQVERVVKKPLFTEFNIGGAIGSNGIYEFNIFAKSVLFGYFSQDIRSSAKTPDTDESDRDDRVGYSFFVGASSVFDAFKQIPANIPVSEGGPVTEDYQYKTDKYTIIGILGPTFDFSYFNRDLTLRLTADAYGDFALIHSHAFKRYSDLHEFGQTKATLENHGYYYALGISLYSMFQLNYSNLELRGKLDYHYFDSIEGLDRFQKEIADEDDFDLKDERFRFNISLGYRIPNTPVQLVVGLEQTERSGTILDSFHRNSIERRSYFQVKYLF